MNCLFRKFSKLHHGNQKIISLPIIETINNFFIQVEQLEREQISFKLDKKTPGIFYGINEMLTDLLTSIIYVIYLLFSNLHTLICPIYGYILLNLFVKIYFRLLQL